MPFCCYDINSYHLFNDLIYNAMLFVNSPGPQSGQIVSKRFRLSDPEIGIFSELFQNSLDASNQRLVAAFK